MKTISIDFDGTLTDIPEALALLAASLKSQGHRVIVITRRYETEENQAKVYRHIVDNKIAVDRVVFAGPLCKRTAASMVGESVDIWIDDQPESITRTMPLPTAAQARKRSKRQR